MKKSKSEVLIDINKFNLEVSTKDYFTQRIISSLKTTFDSVEVINNNLINIKNIDQLPKYIEFLNHFFSSNNYKCKLSNHLKNFLNKIKQEKPEISFIDISKEDASKILKKSNFYRTPTKEQFRDLIKMLKLKNGANFSVPGAGKTTVILSLFSILKFKNIVNKLFVICPINAFVSWKDEVNIIYNNKLNIKVLSKKELESPYFNTSTDIILINFEKFRKNNESIRNFFNNNKIHLVIDESHRIKAGYHNLSYDKILSLSNLSKRRDILTGTPVPQSINDLINQFKIIWPYENIINESDTPKEIQNKIQDLYVRTQKNELGLKDPIIDNIIVELGPYQKQILKLLTGEISNYIDNYDVNDLIHFKKIGKSFIRLIQASTNPHMISSLFNDKSELDFYNNSNDLKYCFYNFKKYENISSKIKKLIEIVNSEVSKKNKVLIWTFFTYNIEYLKILFKDYNPAYIYGAVPSGSEDEIETREGQIKKFHVDDSCKVMIANPQACSEGISLHKVCHFAIYLDRNYNAAQYLQSLDRIHRLGLDKNIETNIKILEAENSIDQKIDKRLKFKKKVMGDILNDPYLKKLSFDHEDYNFNEELKDFDIDKILSDFDINDIKSL